MTSQPAEARAGRRNRPRRDETRQDGTRQDDARQDGQDQDGAQRRGKGPDDARRNGKGQGGARRDAARQEQRAQRILDAAAELVLRWGYDKTTIDDVARLAGVAKGTIYLHWKTREELFMTLLRRERFELLGDVERAVAGRSGAATLRGLLAHVMLSLMRRPLLKAVLLRDMEVIGKLARAKSDEPGTVWRGEFVTYLRTLRERELIRGDLSLAAQVHMVSAIFLGFLVVPPVLPGEFALPDEEAAELLAEAVGRALDRGRPLGPDEAELVSGATLRYVDHVLSAARAKYGTALGLPTSSAGKERT